MSGIRSIVRTPTIKGYASAGSAPIYVDSDDNKLKYIPAGSGTTEVEVVDASATQTLTNKTLTSPVINGAVMSGQGVVATASTLAVTAAAHAGKVIVLDRAAGITVTLPAATGTFNIYTFLVLTALSAANHVIQVANATDYMRGVSQVNGDDAAGTIKGFSTADTGTVATESDTITLDGSTKSGYPGTMIEIVDIGTAVFAVSITGKATGTEATPFSAAV